MWKLDDRNIVIESNGNSIGNEKCNRMHIEVKKAKRMIKFERVEK